jgi:hypothetical protein
MDVESAPFTGSAGNHPKGVAGNRLKRRLDKDVTLEDLLVGWTQCCYLVARKQKLCNIARAGTSMYCGNHQSVVNDLSGDGTTDQTGAERIPCPIDSTHTIYKRNLKQHIKICTKQRQLDAMSEQRYFKQDCNSAPKCEALQVDNNVTPSSPEALADKVNACYDKIIDNYSAGDSMSTFLDESVPPHVAAMYDTLSAVIGAKLGQNLSAHSQLRHVEQDVLIAQQMIAHDLLTLRSTSGSDAAGNISHTGVTCNTPDATTTVSSANSTGHVTSVAHRADTVYVELGAGRGLLSQAVSCVDPTATVVLVERSGSRKKVDRALKDTFAAMDPTTTSSSEAAEASEKVTGVGAVHRARMDIRHCFVPGLPGVKEASPAPPMESSAQHTDSKTGEHIFPWCLWFSNSDCAKPGLDHYNVTTGATKPACQALLESHSLPQPVVIIAKHLCGVATDLAIHSARSFPHIPRGADGKAAILLFCVWTVSRVYTTLLRCTALKLWSKNVP